jgi:hypothetical protein
MSPTDGDDCAAAVIAAASGIADDRAFCLRAQSIVAGMNALADAAGMRRSGSSQSQRDEVSREREEQQKLGDPTMHVNSKMLEELTKLRMLEQLRQAY